MDKISKAKVAQVLKDAQVALLTMAAERDKYAAENTQLKQRRECEKLASEIHSRGLDTDRSLEELADSLEKEAQAGALGEIQRAVAMIGPNMSFASHPSNHDQPGGGSDALTQFLFGNVG